MLLVAWLSNHISCSKCSLHNDVNLWVYSQECNVNAQKEKVLIPPINDYITTYVADLPGMNGGGACEIPPCLVNRTLKHQRQWGIGSKLSKSERGGQVRSRHPSCCERAKSNYCPSFKNQ